MIVASNECVDCGLPCLYTACPYFSVIRYYCDICDTEVEDLWYFNGLECCQDCILKQLEKVELEDYEID